MERQRPKEVPKEVEEKRDRDLEELRRELARLKQLKKQKELQEIQEEEISKENKTQVNLEERLNKIEDFLTTKLGEIDSKAYAQNAEEIEKELQIIEKEIIGEKAVVAKEVSTYELLLNDYPWLEQKRYIFMFSIPNKKKNTSDYESWKSEWSKVLFDYARYAILHILFIRSLHTAKPFSKFENRDKAIREIAEELVEKKQAEWLSKNKEKLRIYWKSIDNWAEEIYEWAKEISPLEPILIFEIRESNRDFSTLPKEDIEEIFKFLEKENRGRIITLEDGQISFKITVD